jgi:hypothetical protein
MVWHFCLLSLVKVVHFETLLLGFNDEPLSSELVIVVLQPTMDWSHCVLGVVGG